MGAGNAKRWAGRTVAGYLPPGARSMRPECDLRNDHVEHLFDPAILRGIGGDLPDLSILTTWRGQCQRETLYTQPRYVR